MSAGDFVYIFAKITWPKVVWEDPVIEMIKAETQVREYTRSTSDCSQL